MFVAKKGGGGEVVRKVQVAEMCSKSGAEEQPQPARKAQQQDDERLKFRQQCSVHGFQCWRA